MDVSNNEFVSTLNCVVFQHPISLPSFKLYSIPCFLIETNHSCKTKILFHYLNQTPIMAFQSIFYQKYIA